MAPSHQPQPQQPWKRHSNTGYTIKTEVRESLIKGAGFGRFAAEPIKSGENICVGNLLSVADAKVTIPKDTTASIVFHVTNEADVSDIEEWLVKTCDKATTESVRLGLSHFLAAGPKTADGRVPPNFLLWQSSHINHDKEKYNSRIAFIKDQFYFVATRDITAGEEFLLDYSEFCYLTCTGLWLKKHNLKSAQESALYYEALAKTKMANGN